MVEAVVAESLAVNVLLGQANTRANNWTMQSEPVLTRARARKK